MAKSAYNPSNASGLAAEPEIRPSGLTTSISSATALALSGSESSPKPSSTRKTAALARVAQARRNRNAERLWRIENGGFVARECGVRFVSPVAQYDPRSRERYPEKRQPLDESTIRECERFYDRLADMGDIEPDTDQMVDVDGWAVPAFRASLLQGLARATRGGR